MTEEEMVGWHHRLSGHDFEKTPGNGEEQGSLQFFSPWCHKELDTTEQLNNNSNNNKGRLETVEGVFEKVLIQWPKLFFLHMQLK